MSESHIVKLERGERSLTSDALVRFARALDVQPSALLPETEAAVGGVITDGAVRDAIELVFRQLERRPTKFAGITATQFADECINLARDLRAIRSAPDQDEAES